MHVGMQSAGDGKCAFYGSATASSWVAAPSGGVGWCHLRAPLHQPPPASSTSRMELRLAALANAAGVAIDVPAPALGLGGGRPSSSMLV